MTNDPEKPLTYSIFLQVFKNSTGNNTDTFHNHIRIHSVHNKKDNCDQFDLSTIGAGEHKVAVQLSIKLIVNATYE